MLDAADLVVLFRTEMSDPELPGAGDSSDSLWEDAEILEYIDRAQQDLCERVDVLFDRVSFCIDTQIGVDLYEVDDTVTKIRRGVVAGRPELPAISMVELERRYQSDDLGWLTLDWETQTGDPKFIITDYEVGYARLVPIPEAVETINLDVYRLPQSAALEIPNKYRRALLDKVKALAYMKDDVDVQDIKRGLLFEQAWDRTINGIDHRHKRRNKGAQVVSYGGL